MRNNKNIFCFINRNPYIFIYNSRNLLIYKSRYENITISIKKTNKLMSADDSGKYEYHGGGDDFNINKVKPNQK